MSLITFWQVNTKTKLVYLFLSQPHIPSVSPSYFVFSMHQHPPALFFLSQMFSLFQPSIVSSQFLSSIFFTYSLCPVSSLAIPMSSLFPLFPGFPFAQNIFPFSDHSFSLLLIPNPFVCPLPLPDSICITFACELFHSFHSIV